MNDEPIFTSTGQALAVAFLVMAHEPRQGSPFRKAILQIMESLETMTKSQQAWFDQLQGVRSASSTINFGGLTSDEIRAQCSMITQTVYDHLPDPERFAVLARFAYQVEKAQGVAGLAEYVRPSIRITDQIAIRALVYGHTTPKQREKGLSYTEISRERGIPVITLRRTAAVIAKTTRLLEDMAIERLTPMFARDGVVPKQEEPCAETT
ncbi:hypothetical protein [Noviherbaspirillum malthae]|uniref:hypothetical protein n=1 Tax=Noviherbaspirillum malthae TaxID=1260987 RepID=UPI0018903EEA|nr:hypothetical protein [Noviherbaspirillum malthae]